MKESKKGSADACFADAGEQRPSNASELVRLAIGSVSELFHGPGGADAVGYARIRVKGHYETWPIVSKGFSYWLRQLWREHTGTTINDHTLRDSAQDLAARALFDGAEKPIAIRVGRLDDKIFIDLCDECWRAVEIGSDGWKVVTECPVRFVRSKGMLALPEPIQGESLEGYRDLVNVPTDDMWTLLVGWMIAALRPERPFPILIVNGEQGSAKSTLCKMTRDLIDPNQSPVRRPPRSEHDLVVAAQNAWVVSFDNLSGLSSTMSDSLCCLATGGGFSARELYTNASETLFYAMRPCQINGIDEIGSRSDLLDRAIHLMLPTIPEERRKDEESLIGKFQRLRPGILGALYDAVATALRRLPTIDLEKLPRMADTALWVTAAEPALGWANGQFIAALSKDRHQADLLALESSLVGPAIISLMRETKLWTGTVSELLARLESLRANEIRAHKQWPPNATQMGHWLRRLAPNLRRIGIRYTDLGRVNGQRQLKLETVGDSPPPASLASVKFDDQTVPGAVDADDTKCGSIENDAMSSMLAQREEARMKFDWQRVLGNKTSPSGVKSFSDEGPRGRGKRESQDLGPSAKGSPEVSKLEP